MFLFFSNLRLNILIKSVPITKMCSSSRLSNNIRSCLDTILFSCKFTLSQNTSSFSIGLQMCPNTFPLSLTILAWSPWLDSNITFLFIPTCFNILLIWDRNGLGEFWPSPETLGVNSNMGILFLLELLLSTPMNYFYWTSLVSYTSSVVWSLLYALLKSQTRTFS